MKKWSILAAVAAILVIANTSFATPRSTASGTLSMGSASARVDSPSRGGAVGFDAAYTGVRRQDPVRVQVLCMQDIGIVYGDAITLDGSPQSIDFTLGENSSTATSVWQGGDATCRADLFYVSSAGGGTVRYLATVHFDAAG